MNELETVKILKNIERHLKNISISARIIEERNREYSDLSPVSIRKLKQHYDFSGMEISIELGEPVYIDHDAWWNRNYSRRSLFDNEQDNTSVVVTGCTTTSSKDEERIWYPTPVKEKGFLRRQINFLFESWENVLLTLYFSIYIIVLVCVITFCICVAIKELSHSNTATVSQQPIQTKILPPSR